MSVNNFDVLKRMSADGCDIRLASGNNILNMKKVKAGTQITIGVEGDVLNAIFRNELTCCLLLWDPKQFVQTKAKLEAEEPAQ